MEIGVGDAGDAVETAVGLLVGATGRKVLCLGESTLDDSSAETSPSSGGMLSPDPTSNPEELTEPEERTPEALPEVLGLALSEGIISNGEGRCRRFCNDGITVSEAVAKSAIA